MKILIGSTIPTFNMREDGHWWHWLTNAERIAAASAARGIEIHWLAVLQHDARGREPFQPLLDRLDELDAVVQWFSLDLGLDEWTSGTRLTPICIGRNIINDQAIRTGADWVYYADSDISAPDDILVRLLELDWPVCGAHVPTYCLDGPRLRVGSGRLGDVRQHWNTAGSLLVRRDVFRRVPWRWDLDAGETDDPATQAEMARLGFPTLVRHDVVCTHHPESIGPVEQRGHDLAVYR